MGLEKTQTGRFDGHCDECDKVIELNAYGPIIAGYKLRQFGWQRYDYVSPQSKARHYLWRCTGCAEKELAL